MTFDEMSREIADLRRTVDRLDDIRQAQELRIKALESHTAIARKVLHYPPVRPLRVVDYKTLGARLEQDDDGA